MEVWPVTLDLTMICGIAFQALGYASKYVQKYAHFLTKSNVLYLGSPMELDGVGIRSSYCRSTFELKRFWGILRPQAYSKIQM